MENWRPDLITVEIFVNFLYPDMVLKGDGYDENGNKVIDMDVPLTKEIIQQIRDKGVKKIRYSRKKLQLRKEVSKPMISDDKIEKAVSIITDVEGSIKLEGTAAKLPTREIDQVIRGFITDIKDNGDAYLNLLDLAEFDDYTYTHSVNVSTLSVLIGMSLNLDDEKIRFLGTAGLLHDIGKTLVPEAITKKNGKLTEEEWTAMKTHPVLGYNIIRASNTYGEAVEKAVLFHHEAYTGGGYPFGFSHEKLDSLSQIISLADVFDALTSKRSYKPSWEFPDAFAYLMQYSGTKFNPIAAQAFLKNLVRKVHEIPLYPVGSYVFLNSGEFAYVVGHRTNLYTLRPIINIFIIPSMEGEKKTNKILKLHQQVDLEGDYKRFVVKRILDQQVIDKFDSIVGSKNPAPAA